MSSPLTEDIKFIRDVYLNPNIADFDILKVKRICEQTQLDVDGNLIDNFDRFINHITDIATLTDDEKIVAFGELIKQMDVQNLVWYKKINWKICHQSYTLLFCEYCVGDHLKRQFSTWTSGKQEIDEIIQQDQPPKFIPPSGQRD
ncbi:hypothetical protein C1645_829467 [Glomus cerebriforme]|uniref:Uncharacterized protein n=1 Tax=Glomus cerebriforme TaxID=658196 RepID=A0A397SJV4_9GLOM|nr:hypothetical protein C1645_829467 [Glomus cerebriforme]